MQRTPKWSEANIDHQVFVTKPVEKTDWKKLALIYIVGSSIMAFVNFVVHFCL